MELKKKRILLIGKLVAIVAVLLFFPKIIDLIQSSSFNSSMSSKYIQVELKEGEMTEFAITPIPEGETREFKLPKSIVDMEMSMSKSPDDYLNELKETNEINNKKYFEDASLNNDGTLTLRLTQAQLEYRLNEIEEELKKCHETEKIEIVISENLHDITYYVEDDCSLNEWAFVSIKCVATIQSLRVFADINDDFTINATIIRKINGEVMYEFHGEKLRISDSEWNEKLKDE
ncbi:MAG: hypothetical protein J6K43_16485 [Lachnospiraceae bacterium]|nr:hypothetical protein [Lachnospiraceae bacterium]